MRHVINKAGLKALHQFSPELAHDAVICALKSPSVGAIGGALMAQKIDNYPRLKQTLWGMDFVHPLGLAAGFDKNGVAIEGLRRWGFAFLEIGTVTPLAQEGNPKPRLFRLKKDEAIINRMGFNNDGMMAMQAHLSRKDLSSMILGINIGKNKLSKDAIDDYRACANTLSVYGNYMVINVSSPNTPGLRFMQSLEPLAELIEAVHQAMDKTKPRPLFVKLAPDLNLDELKDIAQMLLKQGIIDGVIISNTTISRPKLQSNNRLIHEIGGLSGKPLAPLSLQATKAFYLASEGNIPIIGCGGIHDAKSAYDRIRAGASLIQVYSALIYHGPQLVFDIISKLDDNLKQDGHRHISEIIGCDTK